MSRAAVIPFPGTEAETERRIDELMRGALASLEAGDTRSETAQLRAVLKLDPNHVAALINLGTVMYNRRSYSDALALYERATVADPRHPLAFFNYGNALDEVGRNVEAIAAYRTAITLDPGYADAHYNLAILYQRTGERRKALPHWSRYVQLDPVGPWAIHARRQIRAIIAVDILQIVSRNPSISGLKTKYPNFCHRDK